MSRLPDAADLLQTARAALLEKLLPALPMELHYEARMLANALAIAARESAAPGPIDGPDERALAAAIRAGEHDRGTARARLLALTRAKLAISNPRLLESYASLFD
ncbi:hypothetical protein A9C11_27420 [Pseudomonas citronellolis]|uniref:DUF6285 domain-containing protein n=1 Tax=Pseudomonas citronellolis TaxID=53408 RepID=A0A1A9KI49_9PSED|nr:DUF6285 domain-containing protein [Pseudomonas citronellolis]ANI17486.1 hypothetical protein A9C11_27420 [Pseudomonas citronellolis]